VTRIGRGRKHTAFLWENLFEKIQLEEQEANWKTIISNCEFWHYRSEDNICKTKMWIAAPF